MYHIVMTLFFAIVPSWTICQLTDWPLEIALIPTYFVLTMVAAAIGCLAAIKTTMDTLTKVFSDLSDSGDIEFNVFDRKDDNDQDYSL